MERSSGSWHRTRTACVAALLRLDSNRFRRPLASAGPPTVTPHATVLASFGSHSLSARANGSAYAVTDTA